MKSAEEWLIWVESTEAVKWTKQLRDAKWLIEEIQRDALEAVAVMCEQRHCQHNECIGLHPGHPMYMSGPMDHADEAELIAELIRAMKPEALK